MTQTFRSRLVGLFIILVLSAVAACGARGPEVPASVPPAPCLHGPSEQRALSLRELVRRVASAAQSGSSIDPDALVLGGLAEVTGWVVDRENGDVLLFGHYHPERPSLHLDDLQVILAHLASRAPEIYVSLDPRPSGVHRLQHFLQQTPLPETDSEIETFEHGMAASLGPQRVRIGGRAVPRESRLAHTLIYADYTLKQLHQGAAHGNVPSPMQRSLARRRRAFAAGRSLQSASPSVTRLWFTFGKGAPRFVYASDICKLETCRVAVRSEAQIASRSGVLQDQTGGRVDDDTLQFCADVTAQLNAPTLNTPPLFVQLVDVYRLGAVLAALEHRNVIEEVGLDLTPLQHDYRRRLDRPMPDSLPALAQLEIDRMSRRDGGTVVSAVSAAMVCGGASMPLAMHPGRFRTSESIALAYRADRVRITESRSPGKLWWSIP